MRLLICAPLNDFSGFAQASRNLFRAINHDAEIDVVARALKYDHLDINIDSYGTDIDLALSKSLTDIDALLQITTCNVEAVPKEGILNGLYSFFETDRLPSHWAQRANMFDFLLVPCRENALALHRSGVNKPILVCPPPCNRDNYITAYKPFDIPNAENRTVFYNICQLSTKKGLDLLLRAYYAAFIDMPDDVLLVLKTYINMVDRSNDLKIVKQFIERIRQGCNIPVQKFPPVLPIIQTTSDDEINSLHVRGDAYVCSSRGEGWGIPVFDALCHGKTVISHKFGGLEGFVSDDNSLVYGGCMTNCFDMPHQEPGLYSGISQWFEPSTAEMSHLMRSYHLLRKGSMDGNLNEHNQKEWQKVLDRQQSAKLLADKFDYRQVSQKVTSHIKSAFNSWKQNGKVEFIIQ